jgi:two-component system cell cycle sensor histidine kinase/response regulator CckA
VVFRYKRHLMLIWFFLLGFCLFNSAMAAETKKVFILHSYHPSYVWTEGVQKGIQSVFPLTSSGVAFTIEYLDTKRYPLSQMTPLFISYFEQKYSDIEYDLVIISDNNALTLFHQLRERFFKGVPAVFCGINNYSPALLKEDPLLTGIAENTNIHGTLELMRSLFPERDNIIVIVDSTATGEAELLRFENEIVKNSDLKFSIWKDMSYDEIRNRVILLDDNSMVLSIIYMQGEEGEYIDFNDFLKMLNEETLVPVFALWDFYFQAQYSVFGGDVVSSLEQGRLAAQLSKKLLSGVRIAELPVITENSSIPVIDYRQLRRFGLPESSASEKTTFLFRKKKQLGDYAFQIIQTSIIIVVLFIICILFFINLKSRRQAEQSLVEVQNSLTALFFNIPGMVYRSRVEPGFPFEFVSNGAEHITGYSADKVSKTSLLANIAYNDPMRCSIIESEIRRAISEKKPFELEYKIGRKDGSVISVWNHGVAVNDGKYIEGLILDVSERVAANAAKRESEGWFQRILNSHNDGIVIHDCETLNILDVNDSAFSMFGYNRKEFKSMQLYEMVSGNPPHTEESIIYRYEKAKKEGMQRFESELMNKNEVLFWCEILIKKVKISENSYILSFIHDITERKKSQVQLKEKEEQLRHAQKMDAIGQLAGGIAHDFNNMLGGILGAAELMQLEPGNRELVAEYTRLIIDTTTHASDLTEKLLAFSRKGKVLSSPINCHKIIEDTIEILKRSIDRRIVLQKNLSATSFSIAGDPGQIQNLILNLGINARDAMPGGGHLTIATSNITLNKEECSKIGFSITSGDYISIAVSDTGVGIDDSVIDKIFEPFFTTKNIGTGTGLGLAAAYGIVTEHKGAITVSSSKRAGSVFTILLPLSETAAQVCDDNGPDSPSGKGTILLADDESFVRNTAVHILEDLGYSVIVAENGKEALELYKEYSQDVDLVLLDMIMPELNGEECFNLIRQINPAMPVILSSGFAHESDVSRMMDSGLSGFLLKPYRRFEIAQIVYKVLNDKDCV